MSLMTVESRMPDPGDDRNDWAESIGRHFRALQAGDGTALERLYDLAARRIYGLALWRTSSVEDASDVVQEVFVRLASRRDSLAGVSSPHTWLLTLAHNAAVDVTRRRKVSRSFAISWRSRHER